MLTTTVAVTAAATVTTAINMTVDQYDTRQCEVTHIQDPPQVDFALAHVSVPVDPNPNDMTINPVHIAFANPTPADFNPADPIPDDMA
jgi:hypothetical protein